MTGQEKRAGICRASHYDNGGRPSWRSALLVGESARPKRLPHSAAEPATKKGSGRPGAWLLLAGGRHDIFQAHVGDEVAVMFHGVGGIEVHYTDFGDLATEEIGQFRRVRIG
jgi:hypothetical protein